MIAILHNRNKSTPNRSWIGVAELVEPTLLVLLAATAEALQAVLAGLVAAEAAAKHEGAGIEEALLLVSLLDMLYGRQLPVLAL